MAEDLQIRKDITRDLLDRIISPSRVVREGAVEVLAVSTGDEDWRPNELIRHGGINIIAALLHEKNTHIVAARLDTRLLERLLMALFVILAIALAYIGLR